jgi:hypothetical protein
LLLAIGALFCATGAIAQASTTSALVGNIQSLSSSPNTYYFTIAAPATRWTVNGGSGCTSPEFVYLNSTQNGYRDLLATVMLAKALGKRIAFIGNCSGTDYFNTHYVILVD